MKFFYISHGIIEDSARGNQIQTRNTFESLQKELPDLIGIFRGANQSWFSKIRNEGQKYFVDQNSIISGWLERIFQVITYKKYILPLVFIKQCEKILKTMPEEKTVYLRIYGVSEGIYFIKKMEDLKIKRLILEFHDIDYVIPLYKHPWEKSFRRSRYQLLFKLADRQKMQVAIVTVSKALADQIKKTFDYEQRMFTVPNGHSFYIAKPKEVDFNKKKIRIVYSGLNFFKIKGINYLIESLYYLDNRFSLKLIGGTKKHREEFKEKYHDLISNGKLVIQGPQSKEIVLNTLLDSDLAVIPLPKGGFSDFTSPLKLFEYMAVGLPIIASKIPALEEILTDQSNALFFKAEDSRDLANKINNLILNPKLAKSISEKAFSDAKEFTYDKRAERIAKIMRS